MNKKSWIHILVIINTATTTNVSARISINTSINANIIKPPARVIGIVFYLFEYISGILNGLRQVFQWFSFLIQLKHLRAANASGMID